MAIVIGDIFMDICTKVATLPQWDTDTHTDAIQFFPGGSAANTARQLRALDKKTILISAVGRDFAGDKFLRALQEENFPTDTIRILDDCRTSSCIVLSGPTDRAFVSDSCSTNRIDIATTRDGIEAATRSADAFKHIHLGGFFNLAALRNDDIVDLVRETKGFTWSLSTQYDAAERWCEPYLLRLLSLMDLVFVNEQEYSKLGSEALQDVKVVVVTLGAGGVRIISKSRTEPLHFPAAKVDNIVDFCGAGDAFVAGFLHKWLENAEMAECCDYANRLAGKNLQREGACARVISIDEL